MTNSEKPVSPLLTTTNFEELSKEELIRIALERQRLEKLGLLVAGIAHNLAGPLAGMLGSVDLLSYKYPNLAADFVRISRIGKRLQNDIRLFLEKSKQDFTELIAEIDFVELIRNELEFYHSDPRLKHKIEIIFSPPSYLPHFYAIPADFSQSFSNLLANAIEAMETSESKKLKINLNLAGDQIILEVIDNGVGMDEATLQHACDPFFSTKKPRSDSSDPKMLAFGLGLTHAKNLLEPLGCRISLMSTPNHGTTVRVEIPYKKINEKYHQRMQKIKT